MVVSGGGSVAGVDFALEPLGSISGMVLEAPGGSGADWVPVTVYDASGAGARGTGTYPGNTYVADELWAGTYWVSTDNPFGYLNELFDDIPCPGGSVYSGACDPLLGDPVVVTEDAVIGAIDFALERQLPFADGFESGTTEAWSLTVP